MLVISKISPLRKIIAAVRKNNKRIGFVPTMGALHPGHISLVKKAKKECDLVVVSIFVNPKQFGRGEDFSRYPRPFKEDSQLLLNAGVDVIFAPSALEMYPENSSVSVDEDVLSLGLCGASRPGHFSGVCTVVAKLFNIVAADVVYFGQKDYQQVCVIKRMARDLNFFIKIAICPTIRESDGLAMSSRNRYLSVDERKRAIVLYQSLCAGRDWIKNGEKSVKVILKKMQAIFDGRDDVHIDYFALRSTDDLKEIDTVSGRVVLLGAVKIGNTRLIDNIIV
jgi:pantoate--beta-alanine ligase